VDVISAKLCIWAGFSVSDIEPSSYSTTALVGCGSVATKQLVFSTVVTVAIFTFLRSN
jgi:hypothetical protein